MSVDFFSESISFELGNPTKTNQWIQQIIKVNEHDLIELNCIFCSDDYLLGINREYLNHDCYTDILTFDNSEDDRAIEGDIFISIERVRDNAQTLNQSFERELHRVIAHGLLHLFGYKDTTDNEKKLMREKEDACLSLQNL